MMIGIAHMAEMGLLTSVAAPALVRWARRPLRLDAFALPGTVALPLFVALHAAVVLAMAAGDVPDAWHVPMHVVLLAGAIVFWLPIFGARRRLSDAGRMVYLFVAMPALDLPALAVIAGGDSPGGLAMIVAMMPIGVIAVAITLRWLFAEEARAQAMEGGPR